MHESYFLVKSRERERHFLVDPIENILREYKRFLARAALPARLEEQDVKREKLYRCVAAQVREVLIEQSLHTASPLDDPHLSALLFRKARGGIVIKRLQTRSFWKRAATTVRLPPGAVYESAVKVTAGFSKSTLREVSTSLGFKSTIPVGEVTAGLDQQTSETITISSAHEETRTLTLPNPHEHRDRLFAIWHQWYELIVDRLEVGFVRPPRDWVQETSVEFIPEEGVDPQVREAYIPAGNGG